MHQIHSFVSLGFAFISGELFFVPDIPDKVGLIRDIAKG